MISKTRMIEMISMIRTIKNDQNDQKWSKWPKMIKNDQKWSIWPSMICFFRLKDLFEIILSLWGHFWGHGSGSVCGWGQNHKICNFDFFFSLSIWNPFYFFWMLIPKPSVLSWNVLLGNQRTWTTFLKTWISRM